MSGNLAMGTHKVTGLGTPTDNADAATKAYVDSSLTTAEGYTDSAISTEVTNRNSAINTAKSQAISTSEGYTDTAISTEVTNRNSAIATSLSTAESYTDTAVSNLTSGATAFTAVNVNSISTIKAASATVSAAGTANAITWAGADYKTAKVLVKFATATHTQVSEVLLTLDSSNNIAITEYAQVGTNGDLGTVTAAYAGGNVSISVTTLQASTVVSAVATLIK
jgi:hypothetical protein